MSQLTSHGRTCPKCNDYYADIHSGFYIHKGGWLTEQNCRLCVAEARACAYLVRKAAGLLRVAVAISEQHKERVKERSRNRYRLNRDDPEWLARLNATRRKCRRKNPKVQAAKARRRAQILGSEEHFTAAEFSAICERYDNKCLACGSGENLTPDHVVPLASGGSNGIANIQPLCKRCNSRKGTKSTDYRSP